MTTLLIKCTGQTFADLQGASSSVQLGPVQSGIQSGVGSRPLEEVLLALSEAQQASSHSQSRTSHSSPCGSDYKYHQSSSFRVRSFTSLAEFSALSSLCTAPVMTDSFVLPPVFSAAVAPVLPSKCFFLQAGVIGVSFISPGVE